MKRQYTWIAVDSDETLSGSVMAYDQRNAFVEIMVSPIGESLRVKHSLHISVIDDIPANDDVVTECDFGSIRFQLTLKD